MQGCLPRVTPRASLPPALGRLSLTIWIPALCVIIISHALIILAFFAGQAAVHKILTQTKD
jgi:hypothetical protein